MVTLLLVLITLSLVAVSYIRIATYVLSDAENMGGGMSGDHWHWLIDWGWHPLHNGCL